MFLCDNVECRMPNWEFELDIKILFIVMYYSITNVFSVVATSEYTVSST